MTYFRKVPLFVLPLALVLGVLILFFTTGCNEPQAAAHGGSSDSSAAQQQSAREPVPDSLRQATFAGGCFWCSEAAFQKLSGTTSVVSGFSGGTKPNPTYEEVSGAGTTDYAESVQVIYDPDQITYGQLLTAYWHHMDPTDGGGQFADRGSQYRPIIFYRNARQKRLAKQSKQQLAQSGRFDEPIAVKIQPFEKFYAAKDYHQDYFKKHHDEYKRYFEASGRGPFVRKHWGGEVTDETLMSQNGTSQNGTSQNGTSQNGTSQNGASTSEDGTGPSPSRAQPAETASGAAAGGAATQQATVEKTAPPWADFEKPSQAQLRKQLTKMQYYVTQKDGTEPAFQNKYYDNERPGIYVDVVSGEPLFSSKAKFHSGTGWPSFYKPLESKYVVTKTHGGRTEVRSKLADSHLGDLFDWSGPPKVPTGKRYCLDSAALKFIPADQLEEKGYGMYADAFK